MNWWDAIDWKWVFAGLGAAGGALGKAVLDWKNVSLRSDENRLSNNKAVIDGFKSLNDAYLTQVKSLLEQARVAEQEYQQDRNELLDEFDKLRDAHQKEIIRISAERLSEIQRIREEHRLEVQNLIERHNRERDDLIRNHQNEIRDLQSQITQLKNQVTSYRQEGK